MVKVNHINLAENSYDILVGQGLIGNISEYIKNIYNGDKIALVTDENVYALYGDILMKSFSSSNFKIKILTLKAGEETKSIESMEYLLCKFAEMELTRKDLIIGFGGGVIGDLSGFVASCYMRGMAHIQIPTTLLAQVDSSVGGKTAVNLPQGKNLVGTFWQPKMVLVDTDLLKTLDDRQFASGMAEVIKYGAIFSLDFLEFLKQNNCRAKIMEFMPEIVYKCCEFKRIIVEKDEKDTGERMILNFGHTFGHIIEKMGDYAKYTHGEGVAIGMCIAARFGQLMAITEKDAVIEIENLCKSFDLPVEDKVEYSIFAKQVGIDKKAESDKINLILVNSLGNAVIQSVSLKEFSRLMKMINTTNYI